MSAFYCVIQSTIQHFLLQASLFQFYLKTEYFFDLFPLQAIIMIIFYDFT